MGRTEEKTEDLGRELGELGRSILARDDTVSGVRVTVFFTDGRLVEYNSKNDSGADRQ